MKRLSERIAIVTETALGIGEELGPYKKGATLSLWDISKDVHKPSKAIQDSS